MDILHNVEAHAVALRDTPPSGAFMTIAETGADIDLPMVKG